MHSLFVHSFINLDIPVPFANKLRSDAFSIFLEQAPKHNFEACLSRYEYYDKNKKQLKKAWIFEDGKWKKVQNRKVDLFYYHGKTEGILEECKKLEKVLNLPTLNHLDVEKICDDKLLTYEIFPDLFPKTFIIHTFYDLQKVIHNIKTDKVVLKPRFGSQGRDVIVLEKNNLKNGIKKDTIVQEFIDSSKGVLNIKKVHDFRVIMMNGKINHAYIRTPKQGLICNASLGADKTYIDNDEIPCSILNKIKKIDSYLKQYGSRVYSADFAMDKNKKPWLIELNSKPGMMYYSKAPELRLKYFNQLYKIFSRLAC